MSDEACSECDLNCPCRDKAYDCWVVMANTMKLTISNEQITKIREAVTTLKSIGDTDLYEISNAIHYLDDIIDLYDEPVTEVN